VPGTPTAFVWIYYAVGISWAGSFDVTNVKNYDIYYSTDNVNFTLQSTTPDNQTSYSVYGLNPATDYWFKVRARDTAGNLSAFSGTLLAPTTPAFGPNFRVTNSAGTSCFTAVNGTASGSGVNFSACVTPAAPPASQKWTFTQNNTFFAVVNTSQTNTLVWTSTGNTVGSPILVNTNTGAATQIWQVLPQGSGLYKIKNSNSGNCLNVSGTNTIQEALCSGASTFKIVNP
jgi:mannan endo-1,4-beta-mannosidase